MPSSIARVVFGLPIESCFDYAVPDAWRDTVRPGSRVLVSFAGKKRMGIVVSLTDKSDFPRLKPVLAVLDEEPVFGASALRLAEVFALRFGCSYGEALELFLPRYWRRPFKRLAPSAGLAVARTAGKLPDSETELLFDYTRRLSWPLLLPRIKKTQDAGHSVIVLVPDAGYLADILPRLKEGGLAPVLLAGGTDKEEAARWDAFCSGRERCAVGFISAVLAPVPALGLIVMFDEESQSYKNDRSPFYHARETVFLRARLERCAVILVSCAPSVEAWHEASSARGKITYLKEALSPARLMDISNFKMRKGTLLSLTLKLQLEKIFKARGKALLYIQAAQGTASVIEELKAFLPFARTAGYERDSKEWPKAADIVVATQALFRFRDSLRFDFSCVLDIDREFHRSDHRASHSAFALTRYLRGMTKELVVLQTRNLDNRILHMIVGDDPAAFFAEELSQREEMAFPPFNHFVALVARSADEQLACAEAKRLYDALAAGCPAGVVVREPQPDRSAQLRGKFRWCVVAQGSSLKILMGHVKAVLRSFRGKRGTVVTVNVDP